MTPRATGTLDRSAFALVLVAYVAWATAYIASTSLIVDGARYFVLFDDAMISMRYARHLAEGQGLVWNIGEPPIEGFTNLLWTLYMAALHWLPLPIAQVSAAVQVSSLVAMVGTIATVWSFARHRYESAVTIGVAIWTAFYLPLNTWALQGMEVGALTLLVVSASVALITMHERGEFRSWPYLLLGLAVLTRLDAVIFIACATTVMALVDPQHRSRHLTWGIAAAVVAVGSQTVFRVWYFGEWLPNTYYLKMTGFPAALRVARGALMFAKFVVSTNFLLFVAAAAAVALRPTVAHCLCAAQVIAACAYSVYVGGDAWEWFGGANRFISPAMPLLFLLAASTLDRLLRSLSSGRLVVRHALATLVIGGMLLNMNLIAGWRSLSDLALLRPPLLIEKLHTMVTTAVHLDRVLAPDARVAVVWAGALPYFLERPCLDLLGKADRHIARMAAGVSGSGTDALTAFYPGHMKWDYQYSFRTYPPDVVVELWQQREAAAPFLDGAFSEWTPAGLPLLMRRASARVDWQQVGEPPKIAAH